MKTEPIQLQDLKKGTVLRRTAQDKEGDNSYTNRNIIFVRVDENDVFYQDLLISKKTIYNTSLEVWNDGNWEIVSEATTRTISHEQAQSIIDVACSTWRLKLADMWAKNIALKNTVEVAEDFYNEMRKACDVTQHQVFDEIFGKDKQIIDFDRIKTGSKVMLEKSGHICGDGIAVDLNKPFDVVLWKSEYVIGDEGDFRVANGLFSSIFSTFYQDGKYIRYTANEVDYITEVISY